MPRLVAGTVIDGLFLLIACVTVNEEIKEDPPNGAMPLPSRPGADALTVSYFATLNWRESYARSREIVDLRQVPPQKVRPR